MSKVIDLGGIIVDWPCRIEPSKRPDLDTYFLQFAVIASTRGTCVRRRVGAVLVGNKHVLATGYNGTPSNYPHCLDQPCPGSDAPSGQALDSCFAIHAEQNALLQCKNVYEIETCYSTASPCIHCVKLLLNTSTKRIVFLENYPHSEAKTLWISGNREWIEYNPSHAASGSTATPSKAKD